MLLNAYLLLHTTGCLRSSKRMSDIHVDAEFQIPNFFWTFKAFCGTISYYEVL